MWSAVGVSGRTGDVGLAVGAVVADRSVTQCRDDGGFGTGPGLLEVFTESDVPDAVDAILDVPFAAGPVLQVGGLSVGGG